VSSETKSHIDSRIDELEQILKTFALNGPVPTSTVSVVKDRVALLMKERETADDGIRASVIRSHKAICQVKKMDEKAAYGNDPAVYYTLGVCGEAGEMANAIVKVLRNGLDRKKILEAVTSELPDVIIYSYVLAYVLDIDLTKLVNEKVEVVVKRAHDGYYGGEIE
jgi:NTP pyrophosphatase (non-canonical NTP hydrolase)